MFFDVPEYHIHNNVYFHIAYNDLLDMLLFVLQTNPGFVLNQYNLKLFLLRHLQYNINIKEDITEHINMQLI